MSHYAYICGHNHKVKLRNLTVFVSAPECRDIEMALYDRTSVHTYVFSKLCSIFQYVIKRWVRAAAKRKQRTQVIMVVYEYTYQDHEYIIRTMNTKHEWCGMLSCSKQIAVSCPKTLILL